MKINLRIRAGKLYPADDESKEQLSKFQDADYLQIDIKNMDGRSIKQNASLHKWCEQIATALNREKFFIQDVIKMNTKWNMLKVKEMIFKPVVKSLYTKESTTKLNKNEFELIIDTIVRYLAVKGVECPDFPNRESLEEITINKKEN